MSNQSTPPLQPQPQQLDPFYLRFQDERFPWPFIALQVCFWLFSILTILMNGLIVASILHSKNLREQCHWLIGAESATNVVLQFNRWPPFLLSANGAQFMPLANCFWLQILPLFFALTGTGLILIIGIERLACIAFPIWYRKKHFRYFPLILLTSIDVGHAFYCCCLVYTQAMDLGKIQVLCQIGDLFQTPLINMTIFTRGLVIHALVIIIYLTIIGMLIIKYKEVPEATRGVSKSLAAIVFVELLFWMPVMFEPGIVGALNLDALGLAYVLFIFYFGTAVASSANLPLLLCMSKLYRREIASYLLHLLYPHQQGISTSAAQNISMVQQTPQMGTNKWTTNRNTNQRTN